MTYYQLFLNIFYRNLLFISKAIKSKEKIYLKWLSFIQPPKTAIKLGYLTNEKNIIVI